jgi:amino acid transporter
MTLLAAFFVAKPFNILLVALMLAAAHVLVRRRRPGRRPGRPSLLAAAVGWALYAAWEWLVKTRTPEADIRVDLLVIWPVLGVLTLWAVLRALLGGRDGRY